MNYSEIIRKIGDPGPIRLIRPVKGGSINEAFQIVTDQQMYFLKHHASPPDKFFEREAEGLQLLKDTGNIRVPAVYGTGNFDNEETAYIVLEWISENKQKDSEERLGRSLAFVHQTTANAHGLTQDNVIGILPQPNGWHQSWLSFLREKRLGYLAALADSQGRMSLSRKRKMMRLLDKLDRWVPKTREPALLHGDLWYGNWLADEQGNPVLVDPAVFFGDREFELAFTELFGGFSARFYDAYREIHPIDSGYAERKKIYQLYYLLVHLVLFGEAYGPQVDGILDYYV